VFFLIGSIVFYSVLISQLWVALLVYLCNRQRLIFFVDMDGWILGE